MRDQLRAAALMSACLMSMTSFASGLIEIRPLSMPPQLDGDLGDWQLPVYQISLRPNRQAGTDLPATSEMALRAGYLDGEVYFAFVWPDPHEDRLHKPYVWDTAREKYLRGHQREDRLAVQLAISGDYNTDWFQSDGFVADMWHWKASRSDPLGLADDKNTIVSHDRLLRSAHLKAPDGRSIYVLRQWDEGDSLYKTKRYRRYDGDLKPKYILNPGPLKGSSTDVNAASQWQDGHWSLELKRKLDTGHADDARFVMGTDVLGGIAVFNRSESPEHLISETLRFRLMP
ncbi:ethylbenzene dehydrogenase-related protein [Marinobacterium jannaschii]|uniref:ethylbenzene dehydrogenase-related protein n=1 Tax=Marinobacterium jannaschii TaxID=64970 RepID=UPI00047FC416|nr:ethylbenzene dehydrogenase-related protein [Marinobacterium jannaschii]